jgi:hypothetical protein
MALLGANTIIHAPPQADEGFAWRSRADELDAAKRRASTSFARLSTQPDSKAQAAAWAQDEIAVLRARVDLLNTLMTNPDNARLCLDNDKPPRVCVMYNRMRCEGETELGPMQSTMAWAVRGAEKPLEHLMSTGELAQAGCVKDLLGLIKVSMPRKDILQPLDTVLGMPPPERLVLKSVAGVNAQQAGHTRVIEGLGEGGTALAPLYQVVWGALDVAAHEAWQNPSTNAAIRLSVLDTAHQVARDAARTKDAPWSSVAYLQVRICHGEECHVLSLTPFCDSESCTVTHLQYAQSVFDVHGPERGILNLAQDPASIHAIPGGKILPLQAYVCLGAHRKTRLSEAQLNYVHAQGLLAHGFDTRLLPPAQKLVFEANRMPAAKSTRVSATGLDVLASSYHIADQVYTTISVVQYPPFGTQFEGAREKMQARLDALAMNPQAKPFKSGDAGYTPTTRLPPPVDDQGVPMQQNLLYLQARVPHQKPVAKKPGSHYKEWCMDELQEGQFYFIDGVLGDPFSLENRIILFDMDKKDQRYGKMEAMAKKISQLLFETHADVWDSTLSFYDNVAFNPEKALVTYEREPQPGVEETFSTMRTVHQQWSFLWTEAIKHEVSRNQENKPDSKDASGVRDLDMLFRGRKNFFYCHNSNVWDTIFQAPAYAKAYTEFSQRRLAFYKSSNRISPQVASRLGISWDNEGLDLDEDQLPIPQRQSVAANNKPDPASVARLQTRISALETRLARARQDENTQFLLERVLEKLDVVD